jgi:hypothetical protein
VTVNWVTVRTLARTADGLTIDVGGVFAVLASNEVDATARATGSAVKLQNGSNIGAAVALMS